MDIKGDSSECGGFAWIWNESGSNLSDRKAIFADYCLYDHNISYYCMDTAEDSESTCKHINPCRRRLIHCGGSAIAATAPVIDADDDEIAQSIAVIFFFNVLAAIFFPILGKAIGFDTVHGDAFGIFAGTAINDTSSVTAAASTWDSMWNLGSETLNKAVTVKLTRTLAIIPITLGLSLIRARQSAKEGRQAAKFSIKRAFPMFILYFVLAAIITTVCVHMGVNAEVFHPLKELSKFMIIMAMAAIGLNSNVIQLIKTGGKPIIVGASCWCGITAVSLIMQHIMKIW